MQYDVLIIGAGPGGYVAAIRAAQLGLKVAVVEKESLGGVCLNWGCIPTKALLKTAQVLEYVQHAQNYGVQATNPSVDFTAAIQRSRSVAATMSKGIAFLFKKNNIPTIIGTATLTSNNTVQVTSPEGKTTSYEAAHIILATGARARALPQLPIDGKRIIDYRAAMTLKKQPKSLIVVGSGAIGMEFAYFYATLGTNVTVLEALPHILPREDQEISQAAQRLFTKKGISFFTQAQIQDVKVAAQNTTITFSVNDQSHTLKADCVLSAVGIQANIEGLGLEQLDITIKDNKVVTDPYGATSCAGVYAIGDITPYPALAHVASAQGIICVEKIAGQTPTPITPNNIPSCTYCHPEIASVGYTEAQAQEAGYETKVGVFPFKASGKAQAEGHDQGFVKVIYEAKYGEWLGTHMIGEGVTELIAEVVVARNLETTGHEIMKSIHPHPTRSEALMEATAQAYGEAIHL